MAQVTIRTLGNAAVRPLDLPAAVFDYALRPHLIYEAVCHYRAKARAGTHATKNRVDVSGGGRKPWKQKKTGRARHGSIRSPLWRGGGVVHGPQPRDYDYPFPPRMRRNALRSALSDKARAGGLVVLDTLSPASHRTRDLRDTLAGLGLADAKVLLVDADLDRNLCLASANLPRVAARRALALHAYDILDHDTVVLSVPAVERLTEWLGA